jgi:hypothetical protein
MSGMAERIGEWVGKGEGGVRITPAEASYMRDWRLTWWAVCNLEAVAEQGNAKANKTLAILQRRLVGKIHPWTSESTVAVHQEEVASIQHGRAHGGSVCVIS